MSNPAVVHSKLSFSGRARWRACPGSVRMSEGLPDKTSPAAAEGTAAHQVVEWVLRYPSDEVRTEDITVPEGLDLGEQTSGQWRNQLIDHAHTYAKFATSLLAGDPAARLVAELSVDSKDIHPLLMGTADTVIWQANIGRLTVLDYKYGFSPVDIGTFDNTNPQLAGYGVSVARLIAPGALREIVLGIYQPRVPFGEVVQLLRIPDVQAWLAVERVKLAHEAAATEDPNAPLVPGEHCRYCRAAMHGKCPTAQNFVTTALSVAAGQRAMLDIPPDELLALYSARSAFKPFLEELEERVRQLATVGHARLQVSEKRGRQMWADPKTAALTLMALGRTDLLQPVALSDALPMLPEDLRQQLVKRSRSSTVIKVIDAPTVKDVAKMFDKYAKNA